MGKYAFLVVREYLGERVSLNIREGTIDATRSW